MIGDIPPRCICGYSTGLGYVKDSKVLTCLACKAVKPVKKDTKP